MVVERSRINLTEYRCTSWTDKLGTVALLGALPEEVAEVTRSARWPASALSLNSGPAWKCGGVDLSLATSDDGVEWQYGSSRASGLRAVE